LSKPHIRVLYYDIETSLQLVSVFGLSHNDWIDPDNLISERHLISACWQWEGEDKVHSVSLLDDPKRFKKDIHDDYHVVKTLHGIMSQADVLIGHNSDSFDKPFLDTRAIYHGLDPLPPITSIDTYKVAKQRFRFNSNKLSYLGTYLGLGAKMETSKGLWHKVLKGDKAAIKEMTSYNKRDVTLLRDVFLKLQPYVANHVNRQLYGETGCPRCGSSKVQRRGYHRAISRVYQRWQCMKCAGWYKSAKAEPTVAPGRTI
jgi:hypothetical protein